MVDMGVLGVLWVGGGVCTVGRWRLFRRQAAWGSLPVEETPCRGGARPGAEEGRVVTADLRAADSRLQVGRERAPCRD
ncbi:hypothetical protein A6A07_28825 [Streptomyces sp. CB03911]|nr:hypothetical protein A6A07_28825 [Streptomyces sp. CB03911]